MACRWCRNKNLAARVRHMPSENNSSNSAVLLGLLVLIKHQWILTGLTELMKQTELATN